MLLIKILSRNKRMNLTNPIKQMLKDFLSRKISKNNIGTIMEMFQKVFFIFIVLVNDRTLKGLIYYLKVPRDKQGQQERWREIIASKVKYNSKQTQRNFSFYLQN